MKPQLTLVERRQLQLEARIAAAAGSCDLSSCQIDDKLVVVLSRAIKANRAIRHLNLRDNAIADAGASAIAACLGSSATHWVTLNLSANPVRGFASPVWLG